MVRSGLADSTLVCSFHSPSRTGGLDTHTAAQITNGHALGYMEVDWDAWPDHDEDYHGPIDTEDNRIEYLRTSRKIAATRMGTRKVAGGGSIL